MAKTFKVWVEIEEIIEDGDSYCNKWVLPDSAGEFDSLEEACQRVTELLKPFPDDLALSNAKEYLDQSRQAQ